MGFRSYPHLTEEIYNAHYIILKNKTVFMKMSICVFYLDVFLLISICDDQNTEFDHK